MGNAQRISLFVIEKLEKYWHDFILSFPWAIDLDGAVVASYSRLPYYEPNHAATINVNQDAVADLWERIVKHSSARGSSSMWFRVTPLTHPPSFQAFLAKHGCHRDFEMSVMTFKSNRVVDAVSHEGKIKEISEGEVSVWKTLMYAIFGIPPEWKEGFDSYVHAYRRRGAKCYLAYIDGRPVGTCSLLSIDGSGGIFSVGTMKQYRKRGIGSALTVRALTDSVKEGNSIHVLYVGKGEYAEQLYRKIGFETSYTATWYAARF